MRKLLLTAALLLGVSPLHADTQQSKIALQVCVIETRNMMAQAGTDPAAMSTAALVILLETCMESKGYTLNK